MKLLYWNIHNNEVSSYIANCISEHNVDIVVLSEYGKLDFESAAYVNEEPFRVVRGRGGCAHVCYIVRNDLVFTTRSEQTRYSINTVSNHRKMYLLVGLHLQDRRNSCQEVRFETAQRLMEDVDKLRKSTHCNNVVIIGDFNANPFDKELIFPNAFNAVLYRGLIEKSESCEFAGRRYKRMYNPTVHFLSEDQKMYGSYYYLSSGNPGPIWNCLDQALVSKSLSDRVIAYEYIKQIGGVSLMKHVKPDASISDHLPLLVDISE